MDNYFSYDYNGGEFIQFGAAHLGALFIVISIIIISWRWKPNSAIRIKIRFFFALMLGVNEVFWHIWHIHYGLWNIQSLLPLNICNLMVLTSVWVLLTRNQLGYEFLYLLGIPAASQVLITPALERYGFPHALFFQIFISHGGIVIAAFFMTLNEGMRPGSWQSVKRVVIWTTAYALVIFIINQWLGSNYLFLAYKPQASTLLDYLGPWPWYFLSMELIGIVLVILLYLPFAFAGGDRAK